MCAHGRHVVPSTTSTTLLCTLHYTTREVCILGIGRRHVPLGKHIRNAALPLAQSPLDAQALGRHIVGPIDGIPLSARHCARWRAHDPSSAAHRVACHPPPPSLLLAGERCHQRLAWQPHDAWPKPVPDIDPPSIYHPPPAERLKIERPSAQEPEKERTRQTERKKTFSTFSPDNRQLSLAPLAGSGNFHALCPLSSPSPLRSPRPNLSRNRQPERDRRVWGIPHSILGSSSNLSPS